MDNSSSQQCMMPKKNSKFMDQRSSGSAAMLQTASMLQTYYNNKLGLSKKF